MGAQAAPAPPPIRFLFLRGAFFCSLPVLRIRASWPIRSGGRRAARMAYTGINRVGGVPSSGITLKARMGHMSRLFRRLVWEAVVMVRRTVWVLLVCTALASMPVGAWAQAAASIESLEVDLRPEFDRPAVLVIYWVHLAQDTPLPAEVSLPIPASAGEPSAVGMGRDAAGQPLQADYTRQEEGDWATITLQTQSLDAQVEFYADLDFQGDERGYSFVWPGGIELGSLSYNIQQPVGATNMVIAPPGSSEIGTDGLTYHQANLGPQSASSTVTISLSYSKSTPELSIEALRPSAPLGPSMATQGGGLERWLQWGAIALAAVLLAGGGYWYWRSARQEESGESRRRHRPRSKRGRAGSMEIDASPVFCHDCGTQAGASDRFCRHCGTSLRQ